MFFSRLKPATVISLLVASNAYAQTNLEPVVVTATRQATKISDTLADVTVIDREEIEKASGSSTLDLIARQPGIQISNNGGAGKTSSIFIRGAEARHTLLLIDGIPVGSATTGTPSLGDIPLSQIDRIEIVRGPTSAVYGSDAIGGVIQIFTRRGEGPLRGDAFAGYGSQNTQEYAAGLSGGNELVSGSFRMAHQSTNGFNVAADPARYNTANGSLPNPDKDGYRQTSFTGNFAIRPAKGHELGVTAYSVSGKNFYDGGGATVSAYADVNNTVYSAYSRNQWHDNWTSTLRYGRTEDSSTNFAPTQSLFETVQNQWVFENQIRLPYGNLLLGYEYLTQEVNSSTAYTVSGRHVSSPFVGYNVKFGKHNMQLAARHDDNSQFGAKATGNFAYGYQLTNNIATHAAIGTAFKAPTFNQLYFPGFGNANLKPEEALNKEIGVTWKMTGHRISLVYFDNKITDLIGGFPVVNINKATITGTTLSYTGTWGPITLNAGIDIMEPRDASTGNKLPRRADQQGNLSINYSASRYNFGTEIQAVGQRFDNAANTRNLPGYGLINLYAQYQLTSALRLEARINNLLDKDYETAWAYAQPGMNAFVGIRYNLQ